VRGIREAVEAAGTELLHVPPCPPVSDPAERPFADLKARLRKAARQPARQLRARKSFVWI
jgi:transposase